MDSLGDRQKRYEDVFRIKLPRRVPKILRIDGKSFHTYLKNANKPYDRDVMESMNLAAMHVMAEMGGVARFAYTQSDECSIVINDALALDTQPWFDNNLQKMVSVSASLFGVIFNKEYKARNNRIILSNAVFDARAFIVPDVDEVVNNLVWRQQDATRNSIQAWAGSMYSHKELHEKTQSMMMDMMMEKGVNWNDMETWTKRGSIVTKHRIDTEIPIFSQDRQYIIELYNTANDDQGTITSTVLETPRAEGR